MQHLVCRFIFRFIIELSISCKTLIIPFAYAYSLLLNQYFYCIHDISSLFLQRYKTLCYKNKKATVFIDQTTINCFYVAHPNRTRLSTAVTRENMQRTFILFGLYILRGLRWWKCVKIQFSLYIVLNQNKLSLY